MAPDRKIRSGAAEPSPVCLCGMTTTQTCEALQQCHRLLGDTYIKQLPSLLASLSHGGACETGALCCCHRFCSFPPLCLSFSVDGTARHPDRHQAFIMVPLMLSDQSVCRRQRFTEPITLPFPLKPHCYSPMLPLSPLTCVQGSWSSPLPPGALGRIARGQCVMCGCRAT